MSGEFTINITAFNYHSDEDYGFVGFVHNMTRVVKAQNPVEDWILNLGGSHKRLDSNGRKKKLY